MNYSRLAQTPSPTLRLSRVERGAERCHLPNKQVLANQQDKFTL